MKLWNSLSASNNNGQNVGEGQYEHISITFDEYFDDIKCLIVFGIKYTVCIDKLFSFDLSTEYEFTPSEPAHMYL